MSISVGTPREERIRRRAYELYQQRLADGHESEGDALGDWLAAEAEENDGEKAAPEAH